MHHRLAVAAGDAAIIFDTAVADAMVAPENSERFVTWADLEQLPLVAEWSDWMLFLHPQQREFADKVYNGPARLRGVSGSGKTSVMIHRARQLAKRYKQPVLLVTLTESMRKLLEILVKQLCGVESALIRISTMTSLARETIDELTPAGAPFYRITGDAQKEPLLRDALRCVRNNLQFGETVLSKLTDEHLRDFLDSEISFVRTRFLPLEYDEYLALRRHGRELALTEKARTIILAAVKEWDRSLIDVRTRDFEAIVQAAVALLQNSDINSNLRLQHRCILVDEVQDLSQLEMRLIANMPSSNGQRVAELPDGLFLVGDGAQTIYRRGFAFKACGISVTTRSFVLKKNYRNTREVLQAAYGLIESYEFADVDEENIQPPTAPDWSSRHGEKPFIVKCSSSKDECSFVVSLIKEMIEERAAYDDANELETQTELPICVIGFNTGDRDRVATALELAGIPTAILKEDVAWNNNTVKISTLESAKGHEFHAVFIVGVCQGTIPHFSLPENEWKREAARLYVGMTRARDKLFLSYDGTHPGGPSKFLAAIQDDCVECIFRNGRLATDVY